MSFILTDKEITGTKKKDKQKQLRVNSYGKDTTKELNRYSTNNTKYLEKKWEWSDKYFDCAVEIPNWLIRYWELRTNDHGIEEFSN